MIIGVAGGTGSGKTTLVEGIINFLGETGVATIQHDFYYKDRSNLSHHEISQINFDHPEALDTDLLIDDLVKLKSGRCAYIPQYDFATHTRLKNTVTIYPPQVIIVEGILIFSEKELRNLFDIKLFVDTDDDIRLIRRVQRDLLTRDRNLNSILEQYLATVRPMHIEFVEPSKKYADLIIPEGHNPVATDLVVAMIRHKMSQGAPIELPKAIPS